MSPRSIPAAKVAIDGVFDDPPVVPPVLPPLVPPGVVPVVLVLPELCVLLVLLFEPVEPVVLVPGIGDEALTFV